MQADITSLDACPAGSIELSELVFGLEPRPDLLHRMVRYQRLKRMAGTHDCKDRSEIKASGRKFVRQKGSGGARHSSRKAPQFRGGGKAFGPKSRSHAIDLPKKLRSLALRHALSAKCRAKELVILDREISPDGKTRLLKDQLSKLSIHNALIVGGGELEPNFVQAARNIPMIDVLPVQGINVYDILKRRKLVLTKAAVEAIEQRLFVTAKSRCNTGFETSNTEAGDGISSSFAAAKGEV
ncbi:MAG: 50S ribosomal protein L4 [Hyphomicrobiaceae bacterium]|nr:50S ribosomal protein L4 [Hyphomicrobiaceae bacterium]